MDRDEIRKKLYSAIQKYQELSGEQKPGLTPEVVPIGDLPGFDSQRAVETIVEVEGLLNVDIPGDANIFVAKDGKHPLNIREIVNRIFNILTKNKDSIE